MEEDWKLAPGANLGPSSTLGYDLEQVTTSLDLSFLILSSCHPSIFPTTPWGPQPTEPSAPSPNITSH